MAMCACGNPILRRSDRCDECDKDHFGPHQEIPLPDPNYAEPWLPENRGRSTSGVCEICDAENGDHSACCPLRQYI